MVRESFVDSVILQRGNGGSMGSQWMASLPNLLHRKSFLTPICEFLILFSSWIRFSLFFFLLLSCQMSLGISANPQSHLTFSILLVPFSIWILNSICIFKQYWFNLRGRSYVREKQNFNPWAVDCDSCDCCDSCCYCNSSSSSSFPSSIINGSINQSMDEQVKWCNLLDHRHPTYSLFLWRLLFVVCESGREASSSSSRRLCHQHHFSCRIEYQLMKFQEKNTKKKKKK